MRSKTRKGAGACEEFHAGPEDSTKRRITGLQFQNLTDGMPIA
jgi:hypothetical protein